MMKTSKRRDDETRKQAADSLIWDVRQESLYDCCDITRRGAVTLGDVWPSTVRLFGNANVGNLNLTNLQISSGLPSGQVFLIGGWHVRTNLPDEDTLSDAWKAMSSQVHATLVVGSRISLHGTFDEMRAGIRCWPVLVPSRETINVNVDRFDDRYYETLLEVVRRRNLESPGFRFWVHLDGIVIRPPEGGGGPVPDGIIERVHRHMIHVDTETRSIEQRIVDWIGNLKTTAPVGSPWRDPLSDTTNAQLQAICDGILERRWNR